MQSGKHAEWPAVPTGSGGKLCPPEIPLTPLTILTLAVTSRHASDAAYHPYAHIVYAGNASDDAYHPYACSALPTCL
ncbi:hypothetical protein O181_032090 [Austropuccinia psidii MF-1]|uniref:Uncharacterized protein n=1 Tax=Austropuccinia psidii MF-1 TaxID=1389203 RepID=A0A9Q3CZ27_9BASI|nr:hypothetical protein [Austropuccinia psidii MF-1]